MKRALGLLIVLVAGCFHPDIADGDFVCGPGGLCPSGLTCASDNHCRVRGSTAIDMSSGAFIGDGTLGAFDLTGMSGLVECNTENGEIKLTPTGGTAMILVPAGQAGFTHLAQPEAGASGVGLWNFTTVIIPKGITVRPQSASKSVFALAATMTMNVAGTIDWRSFGGFGGLAASPGDDKSQMVNGGGLGGGGTTGGGGGGHRDNGKPGAPNGGGGGLAYGTPDLIPLFVGSGGGGGGPNGNDAGRGGLGGGAIALFGTDIVMSGTLDVRGNAGGDANTGVPNAGGGGGGSGGSLLVSGAHVVLDVGHNLLAAGGRGGHGVSGGIGLGISGGDGAGGRIYVASDSLQIATGMTAATSDIPAVLGGAGSSVRTFPR